MSTVPASPTTDTPDVARNAGFAMFAKVFYLVSRLAVPPLVLAHVTLAEYGLWSAAFVLIMYIGLTDVGFSNVYLRFVARFLAQGDIAASNRLLSTGVYTLAPRAVAVCGSVARHASGKADYRWAREVAADAVDVTG